MQAARISRDTVTSVFFGGGTPSLMEPATVGAILDAVAELFPMDPDLEVTLEANPTSVEADRFRGYSSAGVNRISMGIQSFTDSDLRALGRQHTAQEAFEAFGVARRLFERVSFDLIYARQNQTLADWEIELAAALAMAVDHVSLYQLTIESGTRFGDLAARNRLRGLPTDQLSADMYQVTQDLCGAAGFDAYEVSNHAKPGAQCRHNLTYWRYGGYLGIGPGAHGRVLHNDGWVASESVRHPEAWLTNSTPRTTYEALSDADRGMEYLLMSLRLREGSDMDRFALLTDKKLDPAVVEELVELNVLTRDGANLAATDNGRMVLNSVIAQLSDAWVAL